MTGGEDRDHPGCRSRSEIVAVGGKRRVAGEHLVSRKASACVLADTQLSQIRHASDDSASLRLTDVQQCFAADLDADAVPVLRVSRASQRAIGSVMITTEPGAPRQ